MRIEDNSSNVTTILAWLQNNVGIMQWSHPNAFWHGDGWHISKRYESGSRHWDIEIKDSELSLMFKLKFG